MISEQGAESRERRAAGLSGEEESSQKEWPLRRRWSRGGFSWCEKGTAWKPTWLELASGEWEASENADGAVRQSWGTMSQRVWPSILRTLKYAPRKPLEEPGQRSYYTIWLICKNSDGKIEQGGMECKKEDYLGGCCQNPDMRGGTEKWKWWELVWFSSCIYFEGKVKLCCCTGCVMLKKKRCKTTSRILTQETGRMRLPFIEMEKLVG